MNKNDDNEKKGACSCGDDCCCGDDEVSMEELTETNNLLINAVVELLIRKKAFSRKEFEDLLEEMQSDSDEE